MTLCFYQNKRRNGTTYAFTPAVILRNEVTKNPVVRTPKPQNRVPPLR